LKAENLVRRFDRAVSRLNRIARSRVLGLVLVIAALIVVVTQWRGMDFTGLQRLAPGRALLALLAYLGALVALAAIPGAVRPGTGALEGGLKAQLVKYVPGGLWQAQPLLAAGGGGSVALFAIGVLAAASLGLTLSGSWLLVLAGGLVFVSCALYVRFKWSPLHALRTVLLVLGAVAGITLSGALVGSGLGLEAVASGREVVGGWGLGVLAVPIPAGIGVREAYIGMVGANDWGPVLALTHRVVTVAGDVIAGLAGITLARRRKG
jgi:hypothetical protein